MNFSDFVEGMRLLFFLYQLEPKVNNYVYDSLPIPDAV